MYTRTFPYLYRGTLTNPSLVGSNIFDGSEFDPNDPVNPLPESFGFDFQQFGNVHELGTTSTVVPPKGSKNERPAYHPSLKRNPVTKLIKVKNEARDPISSSPPPPPTRRPNVGQDDFLVGHFERPGGDQGRFREEIQTTTFEYSTPIDEDEELDPVIEVEYNYDGFTNNGFEDDQDDFRYKSQKSSLD